MPESGLIETLIQALRVMPGVGPKSAQRIAFHLLQRDRQGGKYLSKVLFDAMEGIHNCASCRNLTEKAVCDICDNPRRDHSIICVVESPIDVMALEQATDYKGLYFVLMGHLSPLDGIGPDEIGMNFLEEKFKSGEVREVILATNPTVEGEATAFYVSDLAKAHDISCTRIAHGVPLGGELEYIDKGTLAHAFSGRMQMR
jgi:recombination protein RecR